MMRFESASQIKPEKTAYRILNQGFEMKKVIWILIGVALLAFIAYRAAVVIKEKSGIESQDTPEKIFSVEVGRPSRSVIVERIYQTGTIAAQSEVTLYSKVSGKLVKNLVQMNDLVLPNQTIALVDRDEVGFEFNQFEVKSSTRGTVAKVFLNPGAVVNPNVPMFHIVDIDIVKAVFAVPEDKIRFVSIGHPAKVTLQAYPGQSFTGEVTNISPVANPMNRTIDVEISVSNTQHKLKPGMYAEAELVLDRRSVVLVPLSAVTERAGKKVVFVVNDSTVSLRPVATGVVTVDSLEITSGLSPNEQIVITGTQMLNDKNKIAINKK